MDLRAVASAVARHRTVTTLGVALAFVLALLAAFRVDFSSSPPSIERRQSTTYESTARLFVTQEGFPWGRSALRYSVTQGQPPVVEGDPDRFAQLARLYAQLANSDRVVRGLSEADRDAVTASVVTVSQFSTDPLPMLDIAAKATSAGHARWLATRVTRSFLNYIQQNQERSDIPQNTRVVLQVINPAEPGKPVNGPSPAMPLLVLLTVLFVTMAGVFVLDNWRFGRQAQSAILAPTGEAAVLTEEADEADEAVAVASAGGSRPRFARPQAAPSTLGHRKS